jgi:hypothetical protein
MLQVRNEVVRSTTDEAGDVRVFHDRFVKIEQNRVNQRKHPAIIFTCD